MPPHLEALERFKESHPDFASIASILSLPEEGFATRFASFFGGDPRAARRVYRAAYAIHERTALLWGYIKDALASPYMRDTLFNNVSIPQSFIDHHDRVPGYDRLFESLDFVDHDHCRSILSPAAYFVDLMRFIETYIGQADLSEGHRLAERVPRLFGMALDCENTYSLVPYIDLVVEVLEDVARTSETPDPYAAVEAATFPMSLPEHLPLEELRLYLRQLKLSLAEIYELFGPLAPEATAEVLALAPRERRLVQGQRQPALAREILGLSPREYELLARPIPSKAELDAFYGMDTTPGGHKSIADVQTFLDQTGLSREQLHELLFLDLSRAEIDAGLNRRLFVNDAGDNLGPLAIRRDMRDAPNGPLYDQIVNLSPAKLDRIYRFLRLARRLDWSFGELDRALRSLGGAPDAEPALRFDGVNDVLVVAPATQLSPTRFTLEAWVLIDRSGSHPIFCKGTQGAPHTQYMLWVTPEGRLAFYVHVDDDLKPVQFSAGAPHGADGHGHLITQGGSTLGKNLTSYGTIPVGSFTHVAVSVNDSVTIDEALLPDGQTIRGADRYQLCFYLNGTLDSTWALEQPLPLSPDITSDPRDSEQADARIEIGRNLHDEFFAGSIKDLRIWSTIRKAEQIAAARFQRLVGDEPDLLAYWPLTESEGARLPNRVADRNHGLMGGQSHSAQPTWVRRDLLLDPLPARPATYGYQFNGRDAYLAARATRGLEPRAVPGLAAPLEALTIEAWLTLDSARAHTLLAKGDAARGLADFALLLNASGQLEFHSALLDQPITSSSTVGTGQHTHVAAVISRQIVASTAASGTQATLTYTVQFFVGGQSAAGDSKSGSRTFTHGSDPRRALGGDLYVGRDFGTAYLHGSLRELRIWGAQRSPTQIQKHKDWRLVGNEPGLIGYWRLDAPYPHADLARDRAPGRNHLRPGGLAELHRPTLASHNHALLAGRVALPATVPSFGAGSYRLTLRNPEQHGLGQHERLTLQLWFRAQEPAEQARKQVLLAHSNGEQGLSVYLHAGKLHVFAWHDGTAATPPASKTLHLSSAVNARQWQQLTLTYDEVVATDAIEFRCYLDGKRFGREERPFRLPESGDLLLGGLSDPSQARFHEPTRPGSQHLVGELADLRIWRRAFAEQEIVAPPEPYHPRHLPPALDDADLLCYLPLTDGYGRSVSQHEGPLYAQAADGIPTEADSIPIFDQTPNARHGRLFVGSDPAPEWPVDQPPIFANAALRLDTLSIPPIKAASLGLSGQNLTLELWLRADDPAVSQPILIGMPTQQPTDDPRFALRLDEQGRLRVALGADELHTSDNFGSAWRHVAWRCKAGQAGQPGTQTLFVDGQAQAAGASAGFGEPLSFLLGHELVLPDDAEGQTLRERRFKGELGELRVWRVARSDDDILADHRRRLRGDEADLALCWVFDQDPRFLLVDASAAAHQALIEPAAGADVNARWLQPPTPVKQAETRVGLYSPQASLDLPGYQVGLAGTIELWVKFARDASQVLLDASNDAGDETRWRRFLLEAHAGRLLFRLHDASGQEVVAALDLPEGGKEFDRADQYVALSWHFDAAARATSATLVLNRLDMPGVSARGQGAESGRGERPDFAGLRLGNWRGRLRAQAGEPLRGQFSQVRIWNEARDAAQLSATRDIALRGDEPGLLVYLTLDAGSGTLLPNPCPAAFVRSGMSALPAAAWLTTSLPGRPEARVLNLDGLDDLVEPRNYHVTDAGTLELWARFPLGRSATLFDASLAAGSGADSRYFVLEAHQGRLFFRIEDQSDSEPLLPGPGERGLHLVLPATADKAWLHIVAAWRYDAASGQTHAALYANPADSPALSLLASATTPLTPPRPGSGARPHNLPSLFIGHPRGSYASRAQRPFQGQIAQVRIWNGMRGADQLLATRDLVLTGDEPDLLFHLPLDEGRQADSAPATASTADVNVFVDPATRWAVGELPGQPQARVLSLNGRDDYLDLPSFRVGDTGTIELWTRLPRDRAATLFDASDDSSNDDTVRKYFVLEVSADNKLYFRVENHSDREARPGPSLDFQVPLPPELSNVWLHIVATWHFEGAGSGKKTRVQLYVNPADAPALQAPALAEASDGQRPQNPKSLFVGKPRGNYRSRAHSPLQGQLSRLRVWNTVRNATQLQNAREHIPAGDEAGLVLDLSLVDGPVAPLQSSAAHGRLRAPAGDAGALWVDGRGVRLDRQFVFQIDRDQIVLPRRDELGLDASFAVEAWLNLPSTDGEQIVLGTRGPATGQADEMLALSLFGGAPRVRMHGRELTATLSIGTNAWHHLAWRYDAEAQMLSMFVDGVKDGAELSNLPPYHARRRLYVGRWRSRSSGSSGAWQTLNFEGQIEELRIWNSLRDDGAIQSAMTRRLYGDEPGLAACWTFEDQQRHTVYDISPERRHLALATSGPSSARFNTPGAPIAPRRPVLTLDGYNDYLDFSHPSLLMGGEWTSEVWLKLATVEGRQTITEQGGVRVALLDEFVRLEWQGGAQEASTTLEAGRWYHLALAVGAGAVRLFLDGKLAIDANPAIDTSKAALLLGNHEQRERGQFLAASVAEARLWARARSEEQVRADQHRALSGREDGLALAWSLDEGELLVLHELTESLPPARLVTGLDPYAAKWQVLRDRPPIPGAVRALRLDGRDDCVVLGEAAALGLGSSFSVEAWLRLDAEAQHKPMALLGADAPGAGEGQALFLGVQAGQPYLSLGGEQAFHPELWVGSGWRHVAWQFDAASGTASIVLDDATADLRAAEDGYTPFVATGRAYLGRWNSPTAAGRLTAYAFAGQVAELRIWNHPRSPESIAADRGRRLRGDEPGLAAYYVFDEHFETSIPSRVARDGNLYALTLRSARLDPPAWTNVDDFPLITRPLEGRALAFDGEQQYLAAALKLPPSFTLEAWVAPMAGRASTLFWCGADANTPATTDFELRVNASRRLEVAYREQKGSSFATLTPSAAGATALPAEGFSHVALTYDSGQKRLALLLNGQEQAETTLTQGLSNAGELLSVGRGDQATQPTYLAGMLQELRLWSVALSAEQVARAMHHPVADSAAQASLAGYWRLGQIEAANSSPDASRANRPLRLGGLEASRTPGSARYAAVAMLDPGQRVLSPARHEGGTLSLPGLRPQLRPHRDRRTVEVWFRCEDPLSAQRQVIYSEGDEQRGLSISVERGLLYFAGHNRPEHESDWEGAVIATEGLVAERWHHAAIMLDGRPGMREGALRALLDGRLVEARAGSQLWGAPAQMSVGGLAFDLPPLAPQTRSADTARRVGAWKQLPDASWSDRGRLKGASSITFEKLPPGRQRLALRYPADNPFAPAFASNALLRVTHAGGTTDLRVNQRLGGGESEFMLGEYVFDAQSSVVLRNDDADGLVVFSALSFTPLPAADASMSVAVRRAEPVLRGQIRALSIWERARGDAEILAGMYAIPAATAPGLLLAWDSNTLPDALLVPLPAPREMVIGGDPHIPLDDLAGLARLRAAHDMPIARLSALWTGIDHTGSRDGRTLFDDLFNPRGTPPAERWAYYPGEPLAWLVSGDDEPQRRIRRRLMAALRVSHAELNALVTEVSGDGERRVLLDGDYLTQLFRLKLLSTLLGLPVAEAGRLLRRMRLETSTSERPLGHLAQLSLRDVELLRERANWMRETGIDLAEYEFLAYDQPDPRVAPPYSSAAVIDLAAALIPQLTAYLPEPRSLASPDLDEGAAADVYAYLLGERKTYQRPEASYTFQLIPGQQPLAPITLTLSPAPEGAETDDEARPQTTRLAVVLARFERFENADLVARLLGWDQTFEDHYDSEALLRAASLIDERGIVPAKVPPERLSVEALGTLYTGATRPDSTRLEVMAETLRQRQAALPRILTHVTNTLRDMRRDLEQSILNALAELLATTSDRLRQVIAAQQTGATYREGRVDPLAFLRALNQVATTREFDLDSGLALDLARLHKTLFLLSQFDLNPRELAALLAHPQHFGLSRASLLTPTQADLDRLYRFVRLRNAFGDRAARLATLLGVSGGRERAIAEFSGWNEAETDAMARALGLHAPLTTIENLDRLHAGFALTRALGSDATYLIELARPDTSFAHYARHAQALLELLRARYDEQQWASVSKPLHDMLALRKRDALTALVMQRLSDKIDGRVSPDLLYEYLLIDVQMGSETDTSRIVQGIASLQLYVQRCLMNLELGVDPAAIPAAEWQWMKNYRVWEANRKVFLFPENYLEPELRDNASPLFEELVDELQQNDVNEDSVKAAYTRYLDKFAALANLNIVGAYHDVETLLEQDYALRFGGRPVTVEGTSGATSWLTGDWTLELWLSIGPKNNSTHTLLSVYDLASAKGWALTLKDNQAFIDVSTSNGAFRAGTSENLALNRWQHLAVVYRSSSSDPGLSIYLDGESKTTNSQTVTGGALDYGGKTPAFEIGSGFQGAMRDIRIWTTARTREQIVAEMFDGPPRSASNGAQPSYPATLLRYWRIGEADDPGEQSSGFGTTLTVHDHAAVKQHLVFDSQEASVVRAPNVAQPAEDEAPTASTLYLIGKDPVTQLFYLRERQNGTSWNPWRQIDITINSETVTPVVAFNKLYLFWPEIEEGTRTEDRIVANFASTSDPNLYVDQEGKRIVQANGESVGGVSADPNVPAGSRVVRNSMGAVMQISRRIWKTVIKYSYYNFSRVWTQPLTYATLDGVQLDQWQRLHPRWQRVYAQRWRKSLEPPLQPAPEKQDTTDVCLLGPASYVEQALPTLNTSALTLSFWLNVKTLRHEGVNDREKPADQSVQLVSFGSGRLSFSTIHSFEAIGEKPQAMQAVDTSVAALDDTHDAVRKAHSYHADASAANLQAMRTAYAELYDKSDPKRSVDVEADLNTLVGRLKASDSTNTRLLASDMASAVRETRSLLDLLTPPATAPLVPPSTSAQIEAQLSLAEKADTIAFHALEVAQRAYTISKSSDTNRLTAVRTQRQNTSDARNQAGKAAREDPLAFPPQQPDLPATRAAAASAMSAAAETLREARLIAGEAQTEEARALKWKPAATMGFAVATDFAAKLVSSSYIKHDAWNYLLLTLEFDTQANGYRLKIYNTTQGVADSLSTPIHSETFGVAARYSDGLTLRLGSSSNADSTRSGADFAPHMTEFQLWSYLRSATEVAEEYELRCYGGEPGLLHIPLNRQPAGNRAVRLVEDKQLQLSQAFAPILPSEERERILLVYGDSSTAASGATQRNQVETLRNTLKDLGIVYSLAKNSQIGPTPGLSLTDAENKHFVGFSRLEQLPVESYVSQQTYPLDRFLPDARLAVVRQQPAQLSAERQSWTDNRSHAELLKNQGNAALLNIKDSYILDVHNQPGWFILDLGDEVFLVETSVADKRIRTAEERLRAEDTLDGATTFQQRTLFFDRDHALEDEAARPQLSFTRLSTYTVHAMSERLFGGGIDALLSLETQQLEERDFGSLVALEQLAQKPFTLGPLKFKPNSSDELDNSLDFDSPAGAYLWEIFFHIPLLIASQLNANQRFAEAQHWYHYIFNPLAQDESGSNGATPRTKAEQNNRYWRFRPFRDLGEPRLSQILSNTAALEAYRADPFDPHAIARLRIVAYQKSVVMKYIDNLLDWADFLFRQDTREAIGEAMQLYVLAYTLLGPRPKVRPAPDNERIGSYRDIVAAHGSPTADFVAMLPDVAAPLPRLRLPFNPNHSVETRFGVVENEQFIGYWDRVEDRLYKLRHSLNIDGVFRSLALFQPAIDPAALVAAAANGDLSGGIASVAGQSVAVPHYRFAVIVEKAKSLIETAMSLGGALGDALEKRDAEALALLEQSHERQLLDMNSDLKDYAIFEAEANKEALITSRRSAEERRKHYKNRLGDSDASEKWASGSYAMSPLEITSVTIATTSQALKLVSGIVKIKAAIAAAVPDFTVGASGISSPVVTVKTGGAPISKAIEHGGQALDTASGALDHVAAVLLAQAGYQWRKRDWELARDEASREIEQIDEQLKATDYQLASLRRDLQIHQRTIEQKAEVGAFMHAKFSNQQLYTWMAGRLSGLYFQTYKMAFDMARQAELAYQYEFGTNETFISFGHWDSRRKGLLAGESLLLDVQRLERAALAQNSRYLEVEKVISLARIDPEALLDLKRDGLCRFSLNELLFDRDYPGHYFRIIKSVAISIPAVVGPYQTLRATLTQTGNKVLLEPSIDGVKALIEGGELPSSVRADWRANQQIAISRGVEDTGMFELSFADERYLPFEGTGAVSTWLLEMPRATNPIDFEGISDVIIRLRYQSKSDGGQFKRQVMELEAVKRQEGARLISLAHEFPGLWQRLADGREQNEELILALPPSFFPPNFDVSPGKHEHAIMQAFLARPNGDSSMVGEQIQSQLLDGPEVRFVLRVPAALKAEIAASEAATLLLLLRYQGTVG
jgi:hypothetical protein